MLVYCQKTGKVYNPDLEFQQVLKDAWDTITLITLAQHALHTNASTKVVNVEKTVTNVN